MSWQWIMCWLTNHQTSHSFPILAFTSHPLNMGILHNSYLASTNILHITFIERHPFFTDSVNIFMGNLRSSSPIYPLAQIPGLKMLVRHTKIFLEHHVWNRILHTPHPQRTSYPNYWIFLSKAITIFSISWAQNATVILNNNFLPFLYSSIIAGLIFPLKSCITI